MLFAKPIITANALARELGVSYVTANSVIARLEELALLKERTGYKRNRRYAFNAYLRLFHDGSDVAATGETAEGEPGGAQEPRA